MLTEEKDQEDLYRSQKPSKYSNKQDKDKSNKKKQTTKESVLHVEAHGHTRTVRLCAKHLDIIVKGVVNKIILKENANLSFDKSNKQN